jgi:hypothetical protein
MKIKTKIKRRICAAVSLFGFLFAIGSVGGVELGISSLGRGAVNACIGLVLFAAATYKGGFMRW